MNLDFTNHKRMPMLLRHHMTEEVTYRVDGLNVRALMMRPHRAVKRIVVYLRGGKGNVGRVRPGRMLQFANPETLVFAPYYRGNNGSEGRDAFYGDDLHDVTVALDILRAQYPDAYIHMVGFSRGGLQGLLTYQALPVDSYIIWGGVTSIYAMYEERVDLRGMLRRMIGHPKKAAAAYEAREGMRFIKSTSPPILIVHGGKDVQVGIQQSYDLARVLEDKNVYFETLYQMNEGHVPRPPALKVVLSKIHQWMDRVESGTLNKS